MFFESNFIDKSGFGSQNFFGRSIGKCTNQNGNDAFGNNGVAVCCENNLVLVQFGVNPNLTLAAFDDAGVSGYSLISPYPTNVGLDLFSKCIDHFYIKGTDSIEVNDAKSLLPEVASTVDLLVQSRAPSLQMTHTRVPCLCRHKARFLLRKYCGTG